jgi:TniQ
VTVPAPERTLPIRMPILGGESLESWLEALARRNGLTMRQLLPAMGLTGPRIPYGLAIGIAAERLRQIERQTGLPTGRLDQAVLDRFLPLGVASSPRAGAPEYRWQRWARGAGSRWCPRCLAKTRGRWLLGWYLNWSFVCLRHRVLLADACPRCSRLARVGENRWDHVPVGERCGHADPDYRGRGSRRRRCGADLTLQPQAPLDRHHPLLAAQRWINQVLGLAADAGALDTVRFAGIGVPRFNAIGAIAALIRYIITAEDRAGLARREVGRLAETERRRPAEGLHLPDRTAQTSIAADFAQAADPALFGVAATLALDALVAPTPKATAEAIAWMLPNTDPDPAATSQRRYSELIDHSTGDPVIDAVMLRDQASRMRITDRLAYRTENPIPRRPLHEGETSAERGWPHRDNCLSAVPARLVPQCAWPSVAAALPTHATKNTIALRTAIAMAVVRTGTFTPWGQIALQLELPQRLATSITSVWRRIARAGHAAVFLAGIDLLVDALLEHPPPIDYARRRWAFRQLPPISTDRFHHACHQAGLVATRRRRRYATMLLWEILTGGDLRLHPGDLRPHSPDDRTNYASFCATDAATLADYLAEEAERHLLCHRIDEPVTWQPEIDDPDTPTWHCPEPDRSRRLAGWTTPSRTGQQPFPSDSVQDQTPRWWPLVETGTYEMLHGLAFVLRTFKPGDPNRLPGNHGNELSLLHGGQESSHVRFVHRVQERFDIPLLAPKSPHAYQLTPTGREFLDRFLRSIPDPGNDIWEKIAHAHLDTSHQPSAIPTATLGDTLRNDLPLAGAR